MKNLLKFRNAVLIVGSVLTAVFLCLHVVLAEEATLSNKVLDVVFALVSPALFYGFVRLCYKIDGIRNSGTFLEVISWFFVIGCSLGVIVYIVNFFTEFPNGFTFTFGCPFAVIIGVLDGYKKAHQNK